MQIEGAQKRPGTALLLTAAPAGKGALVDTSRVVPALAAVPPAAWTGTAATTTLIELADPTDPQAVLTRIRGAAATEGPLTVVLVGQLQLDRRQQQIHLALARTTPPTVRYTALPWAWLVQALQQRRPRTTTVHVDLIADAEAWQLLGDKPLSFGGAHVYGVIAPPPPGRRRTAQPSYAQALARILRGGHHPGDEELHHAALRGADLAETALVLGPMPTADGANVPPPPGNPAAVTIPAPTPPPPQQGRQGASPAYVPSAAAVPAEGDPHERIAAASKAGRHYEAAELAAAAERYAVQTYGADTFAAVHWVEVRAFLASVAQEPGRSCELWLRAAETRLDVLQQATDARDVETSVDGAHHQWMQMRDAVAARALAPRLIALRRQVPGRQPGALTSIQRMLERLNSLPPQ
ncbi:hypothetical protein B1H19_04755 [Streptomyces gilvosporeus]|uniref:Uncharacterized protein n=1 Tax=Streptomyces gilvosporeus TaxID=553510 RepID=A0A1V0TKY3_9ACTN|nr:hypothetical protein [Streptomyces gilvosporeus]ARF53579.1 hypothetical protein B1H19_04755 [Streptomyces gilvosporeus]